MKYTLTLIFSIICFLSIAQETLEGTVLTNEDDQEICRINASMQILKAVTVMASFLCFGHYLNEAVS